MLALATYQAQECGGCGGYLPDTTAPEAEGGYATGLAIRCHSCTARSLAAEKYRESPQPDALRIRVQRKKR